MPKKKSGKSDIRWSWKPDALRWQRQDKKGDWINKPDSAYSNRESDTSQKNILKQWNWVVKTYPADDEMCCKNTIVKRIPKLAKDTPKSTKASVDGRLRALSKLIEAVQEQKPDAGVEHPPKLSWHMTASAAMKKDRADSLTKTI